MRLRVRVLRVVRGRVLQPLPQVERRVELTDRAAEAFKAILRKAGGGGIRVDIRDSGRGRAYKLTMEERARRSDVVVESKGVPLYIPADRASLLELQIDYVREDGREGFIVQSLDGCGCGPGCACGGSG